MPWVSTVGRSVLMALVKRHGYPGPADSFAASIGVRNRYQLSRILQRDGLPCLEELAGWVRLLTWVTSWETSGVPLSRSALSSLRDPSPMFRLVERLTGHTWTQVRSLGSDWVFLQLLERCRRGADLRGNGASGDQASGVAS
jgi:hypothetical protein